MLPRTDEATQKAVLQTEKPGQYLARKEFEKSCEKGNI